MARFLKSIPWWTLEPHPDSCRTLRSGSAKAVPGNRYVVFLRWGGGIKVDLRPSSESDRFRYTWIDLTKSAERASGTVNGGAARQFHPRRTIRARCNTKIGSCTSRASRRDRRAGHCTHRKGQRTKDERQPGTL